MVNPEHDEPPGPEHGTVGPALGLPWDRRAVITAVLTAFVLLVVVVGAVWTARHARSSEPETPPDTPTATPTAVATGDSPTSSALPGCDSPAGSLETLTASASNPTSLTLAATPYDPPYGYPQYPLGLTLTNAGSDVFAGWAETAALVVTNGDAVVVGTASLDTSPTSLNRIEPGFSVDYPDPPQATRCPGVAAPTWGGDGLPAGDYSLWVVVPVHETSPDHTAGQAVAGPVPWTVADPAAAAPYACGAPVDRLQGFVSSASPFTVSATVPTAPVGTFHLVSTRVTNTSGTSQRVASLEVRLAYVQDGKVVGGDVLASDGTAQTVGDAPITFGDEVAPVSCTASGTDPVQDDGPPLPAGQYEVWTFTSVVLDPARASDPSSAYVANGPWPVTLTGADTSNAVRDVGDAFFVCHQPVDPSRAASGSGLTLDLHRTQGPWVDRGASDTSPDGTLRSTDGREHPVAAAQAPSIALTDSAGNVAWIVTGRYQDLDLHFIAFANVRPEEPDDLFASTWVLSRCPSQPGWPPDLQPAGTTVPAGTYTAWPYVVVDQGNGPQVLLGTSYPMSVG